MLTEVWTLEGSTLYSADRRSCHIGNVCVFCEISTYCTYCPWLSVRYVTRKCAQSLHVIKMLRSQGMNDKALQAVFRSVVIAKLLYAFRAWWASQQPMIEVVSTPLSVVESGLVYTDRQTSGSSAR